MKTKIKFPVYIFLVLLLVLCGCINDKEPDGIEVKVGDYLPDFSVTMSNGEKIETGNLIGSVGLIMFFNTNCQDCRKELPVIQEVWDYYYGNKKVKIVLISREESQEEIKKYWEENNLSMNYSPQRNRYVYNLFAKTLIPRIYIYDKEGKVIFASDDSNLPTSQTLIKIIDSLI